MATDALPPPPVVLAIESSCDDTACAVVDGGGRVLASVVSSQLAAHRPWGGVVPEIASREHLRNWPAVSTAALAEAGIGLDQVDAVAATRGPGLVGSLLVGLSLGRGIAHGLGRPFHGIHHLEGHLVSPFLATDGAPAAAVPERFVGLVVSGGHTSLLAVEEGGRSVRSLAETRDDAMGEVFDKVGKRLGLAYPQGPLVDRLAERATGTASADGGFSLPPAEGELFFSFSGLKSQALRAIERLERDGVLTPPDPAAPRPLDELPAAAAEFAAAFRATAVAQVIDRLRRLVAERPVEVLAVSGGAAANRLLRRELESWAATSGVTLRLVPLGYAGDNAAMIGWATVLRLRRGEAPRADDLEVQSRLPFAAA